MKICDFSSYCACSSARCCTRLLRLAACSDENSVEALRNGRGGLTPCRFDLAAELTTYVGEVRGLDAVHMRQDALDFDCRNNRIAQLALEQDDFADAVAAARERYGPDRIGVFAGTIIASRSQTAFHAFWSRVCACADGLDAGWWWGGALI